MIWNKFEKMKVVDALKDHVDEVWKNNRYEVQLQFMDNKKGIKGAIWLQFKDAINKDAIHDWRDMQRIKNEICGEEREAVELFPAESRLVDTSNQFHLFVLQEGEKAGFGYDGRAVVEAHNNFVQGKGGSKQREWELKPKDLITMEECKKQAEKFANGEIEQ